MSDERGPGVDDQAGDDSSATTTESELDSDLESEVPDSQEALVPDAEAISRPVGNRRLVRLTFAVAAGVLVLDQLTKYLAVRYLENHEPIEILGQWLRLYFLRNSGAAFSIGTGVTFIFTAIAVAVAVVIVRTSRRLGSLWWAIALGGLLGGAVGNLLDRLFRDPGFLRGHVVDFISVQGFAVFNVADSAIVCSAIAMVLLSLRGVEIEGTRS